MFHLSVLPLSLQLTKLSGSVWNRTLQGQRAQRIEMLLLHKFYSLKFLLPDKMTLRDKARLAKAAAEDGDEGAADDGDEGGRGGRRKKAAYAGGLVLEPKKGLYNNYVLMLDFNSLYPSIIQVREEQMCVWGCFAGDRCPPPPLPGGSGLRNPFYCTWPRSPVADSSAAQEFNICFTTVERPKDGSVPSLPAAPSDFDHLAPLPTVIRGLVLERRKVKDQIKRETDPVRRQQLDVRQQALKLTANSMYGCLGFSNSRFFARPLAELITYQGREILQSTVHLVEGSVGLEVIYGDTDSIFINTKAQNLDEARSKGAELKKVVNKRFRLLEMELDGVFKSILLLKKKKYAAIKVELAPNGEVVETMEQKGLDIVRRDWCPLAKDCGNYALERILSGEEVEEVAGGIHAKLEETRRWLDALEGDEMRRSLHKFLIFKQLTKRPEDYPDARNQPHVQVALRRRLQGKRDCVNPGDTVPYIICQEFDPASGEPVPPAEGKGLADRAYHIEEVRNSEGRLRPDIDYYVAQQVHPVVSRLCTHLEGTDPARIAQCLGLDPSRFRGQALQQHRAEEGQTSYTVYLDASQEFESCEPLVLRAPEGGSEFAFAGVLEMLKAKDRDPATFFQPGSAAAAAQEDAAAVAGPSTPLDRASFANQIRLRVRQLYSRFFDCELGNEEEPDLAVRQVCLRPVVDGELGTAILFQDRATRGRMHRRLTKAQVHKELRHLKYLLDADSVIRRVPEKEREQLREKIDHVRDILDAGLDEVRRVLDMAKFNFVQLGDIPCIRGAAPAAAAPSTPTLL